VLITGATVTVGLTAVALRQLDYERIPQAAVLAATFFVASLVSVPVGPSSVHLLLNGLMGLLLGWAAVPALLVALLLQAVFFGYGGVAVLGVNTMNLAVPALLCAALLRPLLSSSTERLFWVGAAAGTLGVLATGLLVATAIGLSGSEFLPAAKVLLLTYLPLALVEAAITGAAVAFMHRVAPELLLPSEGDGHA
jgi:cobalt/nickel transport system permease protein